MVILESNRTGYTYIGSDNNYYCAIRNYSGAPDDIYPMELGPHHAWDEVTRYEDWEECPF
jgi:hypothetical protein